MLTGQEYSNQLSVGRGKRVSTTIFMVFTEVLKTRITCSADYRDC